MLELYYWSTPNGNKILIFCEEAELDYKTIPIDIGAGDQFQENFLKISPNNRIPAIVDHRPDGPFSLFESGAILLYLAESIGRFLPSATRERYAVIQWLMWQMGGLGPMLGQNHHFVAFAKETVPYAIDRYVTETTRLYTVLNHQLRDKEFIGGEYSIADMACYPWIVPHERQQQNLDEFPDLKRWFETVSQRPAVVRAYQKAEKIIQKEPPKTSFENVSFTLYADDPDSPS